MGKFRSARGVAAAAAVLLLAATGCGSGAAADTNTPAANASGVAKAGTLKIGTSNNTKPYTYEENGKLTGFDVDLISAAARKLKLNPQFVSLDFAGLLPAVNNRQFDVAAAAVGITPGRVRMVDFSNGYLAGYFGLLTGKKSGITSKVPSVGGKKIAVLQGSITDLNSATLIPGAQIVRFPDNNTAALALKNNRVDGFFNDYGPNRAIAKKYPDLQLSQPLTVPATDFPAGWAVRKGNTALRTRLDTALEQVVADGTWLKLYKEYFPEDPVPSSSQLPPYKAKALK
ncbi:ABC transporter substrate-binding protein [Streptomyces sp. TP-A0356]|uniref:substrate-binding periplasmic protein n=1 Tax=Streptomyces sp. TP-A0356 TaxID=1359208 RepID=UPI0006E240E4|nr:ABC transporter substrate-binding protein [Streptomyces sp. TP-A0356]